MFCCGPDLLDGTGRGLSAWRKPHGTCFKELNNSSSSSSSRGGGGLTQPAHRKHAIAGSNTPSGSTSFLRARARYLQKPSFQEAEASGAFLPGSLPPDGNKRAPENEPESENPAPEVAIDSGVVVFSGEATSALARLAYSETFKGCTARGVAEGVSALRLELYSDLLLALKTGAEESEEGVACFGCFFALFVAFFFLSCWAPVLLFRVEPRFACIFSLFFFCGCCSTGKGPGVSFRPLYLLLVSDEGVSNETTTHHVCHV